VHQRCIRRGVLALISGNRCHLIGALEDLAAFSKPLLGELDKWKRPRERTIFSRDMALGGKGEEELIQAAGTLLTGRQVTAIGSFVILTTAAVTGQVNSARGAEA
jgi:hypothetical protein